MIPSIEFPGLTQEVEAPDLLVCRITTEGELAVLSMMGAAWQAVEVFFGKSTGVSVAARRELKNLPVLRPYAFVGCVESLALRGLVHVLAHGMAMIGRMEGKIVLFKTEAEARTWIEEDRLRRSALLSLS